MKKFIYFLLVISLISLVGCGYTSEEQAQMDELEENGVINATKYIKDKYGFIPTVIDKRNTFYEGGPVPDFSPNPTGIVHVTMEYEGKEFVVEISGEEDSLEGEDDYQKEEILSALNDYIVDQYPMVKGTTFYYYEQDDCYFSELLTDENIRDFIKDTYVAIKVCGNDVSEFPVKEFAREYECDEVNVIEYKDENTMPFMLNSGIWTSSGGPDMDSILPYINQYLWYDPSDGSTIVKDVYTKNDKGIVVCTLVDEPVYILNADKSVSDDDLLSYQSYVDSYRIRSNAEDVWIYIPNSMVDEDETIAVYCGKYEELTYDSLDYTYFYNLVIQDDESDQYRTSFIFNICSEEEH